MPWGSFSASILFFFFFFLPAHHLDAFHLSVIMSKPAKILEKLKRPFVRRKSREATKEEEDLEAIAAKEEKVFRYEILVSATRNFKNKLGEGGFGPVFKGQLADGRMVAVKRLGLGSRQGVREFTNEATLLSRVQHKNVVNLYGYCAHANHKLLVYEYVPNESLDKNLFSRQNKGEAAVLDWKKRYEVIVGVARGLQYLHEDAHTPIIHRDIKASNILLDERWCPKIADFGMARLFPEDLTHVNTRVAGTNCYMAPEYAMHGLLSTKVDVFSFGVLMIELITGQKSSEFIARSDSSTLIEWAWLLHCRRQWMEMLDPALRSKANVDQVVHCAHIGLLCTQSDPKVRPNMRRVVMILSKKPSVLEEPMRPGVSGSRYRVTADGLSGTSSNSTAGEPSTSSSSAATWSRSIASVSNVNTASTSFLGLASTTASSSTRIGSSSSTL